MRSSTTARRRLSKVLKFKKRMKSEGKFSRFLFFIFFFFFGFVVVCFLLFFSSNNRFKWPRQTNFLRYIYLFI